MSLLTLIHGSAHQIDIPDKSVQTICTSPPYWGLRKYAGDQGIEWPTVEYAPMAGLASLRIQGCEPECEHEWAIVTSKGQNGGINNSTLNAKRDENGNLADDRKSQPFTGEIETAYCLHCGGWRGELGLEPTPEMYIAHLILCLREWRRVLRDDGTCWVNLGDSYSGSGKGGQSEEKRSANWQPSYANKGNVPNGLKPKDLCGIPWRFAFAAQAEGFYLRSDIIWAKPNPMPESVGDRPTKAHEYIFLLSKSQNYYFDADAVREAHKPESIERMKSPLGAFRDRFNQSDPKTGNFNNYLERETGWGNLIGRNLRTVWTIATQPTPFAHFATYPEKIPETAILAGTSARGCCPKCGAGWVRQIETTYIPHGDNSKSGGDYSGKDRNSGDLEHGAFRPQEMPYGRATKQIETLGWQPSCTCNAGEPVPCVTLDPFHGSGTTGKVAIRLGRRYTGVDISEEYLNEITSQRLGDGIQMEISL